MPPHFLAFLCPFIIILAGTTSAQNASPAQSQEPPDLSANVALADCLSLVLEHSPELAVYAWEPRMAEARTLQAGLRPNPELSLDVEDISFGGQGGESRSSSSVALNPTTALGFGIARDRNSGNSGGLDSAEITLSLSQLIELGGKRMKRVRLAQGGERVVDMDYEVLRAEVLTSTTRAFYDVLLLQHRLEMATSFVKFAEEAHGITQARVQAGKISPLEETRSDVELQLLHLETEHTEHELEAARIRLVAHWGSITPHFGKALGSLTIPAKPEDMDRFLAKIEASPDVQRWTAERARRESALSLERALGRPDITVTAGLRTTGTGGGGGTSGYGLSTIDGAGLSRGHSSTDDRDYSFLVGVSVPLQFFHRNQGRIREAEYAVERLSDEERALLIRLRADVSAEWQTLAATYNEASTLDEQILPKAQQAFEATQEGYRQGKFGLLDVLLSQRALFEVKKELLETYARHYRAKVELERYTGHSAYVDTDVASPIEEATP